MKRCPECRRDYVDDSLLYCLEDGAALLQGSVPSPDEPPTVILHESAAVSESATRPHIPAGLEHEGLADPTERHSLSRHPWAKPLMAMPFLVIVLAVGFFSYRYF